ncbi:hypothetical protein F4778DRAFT_783925 [Xylariomycetidae sp. FL2044]|nr:hypothetical protein F4778DRAFT_783925 [Xylariomycetidae sp. FL2044]
MRFGVLCIVAIAVAVEAKPCNIGCGGAAVGTCLRAIADTPLEIGEAFCSSWLSQAPVTTVVTEVVTATSTHTSVESVTTILMLIGLYTYGMTFVTDGTGVGEISVRFLNPSGKAYLYYYADEIVASAV